MINNSSLEKWNRLRQKDLDHQFMSEIMTGLNCSPFEAEAVLDTVHKTYGQYFQTSGAMAPGQIIFQVVSVSNGPQVPIEHCQQVTVILTLDAGAEDLAVREEQGVVGLRRHRIERLCHEAYQQGGLLTVEDLANRLFNCGERTLSRDLTYFREQGIAIPLRSTIKDMGRSITHRTQIVQEWLLGKEYSDISRNQFHSIPAIRNYIDKFKRSISLWKSGFDLHSISFLAKLSVPLVEAYIKIYQEADIIEPRQQEIENFLKKNELQTGRGGDHD
jgi:hypothetical protein